jgi:hypothetical protein
MSSTRRCVAAGAWLLAAGLLSGSGAAIAFADVGSHHTKHANGASEAKRDAPGGDGGTKQDATAATRSEARSAHRKAATRDERRAGLGDDPDSKPTTQITRSATTQMSAREIDADAAPTNDDTEPAGDPTPPTGTAPTGTAPTDDVASSPTPDDPTQTAPPPTDVAPATDDASAPDTSAATVPVWPTYDAPVLVYDPVPSASDTASSDSSSSDSASSDTTAGSTAPDVEQQDASQPSPDPAPPTPEVTTVSQEEVASPTDTVAPPTQVPATTEEEAAVAEAQRATDEENNRRRSAGLDERGLSPLQILRLLTRTSGSAFAGDAAGATLLNGSDETLRGGAASAYGTNAAPAGTSSRSMAAREPNAAMPEGLQTFLYTCGQIVVAVSLSAMLLAALPGLAGLVIPAAAGVHIGYRQAKAGRAVRNSGIAHLAVPGPIGVIRSGSLIALRSPSRRLPPARIEALAQQEVA